MQNFSSLIFEASDKSATEVLKKDITSYINRVGKKLPPLAKTAIDLLVKYNIDTRAKVEIVRTAEKGQLKHVAAVLDMDIKDTVTLWNALTKLGNNIRLLPHYQTKDEREAVELGNISVDDLTIDLSSNRGRNNVAKQYTPIVLSMANKYAGVSKLNYDDLISAGMEGLAKAIDTFKTKKQVELEGLDKKVGSFSTYAYGMILYAIKDELGKNGFDLSGTYLQLVKKLDAKDLNGISIDSFSKSDDDKGMYDRILAQVGSGGPGRSGEEGLWKDVFLAIDSKFPERDANIFYRKLGVNGFDKEKASDIAKSYGISNAAVTVIEKKIIKFLSENPRLKGILREILTMYNESMALEALNNGSDRRTILECLVKSKSEDETYLYLEELLRWDDPEKFRSAYDFAMDQFDEDGQLLLQSLIVGSYEDVDAELKKQGDIILNFLRHMYPTTNFSELSDVDTLELFRRVQDAWKNLGENQPVKESNEDGSNEPASNEESITSEEEFREYAKKKFEAVFGDDLDEKRMKFTIDGLLDDNKEDVEAGNWGELVGKLNKSFGHN